MGECYLMHEVVETHDIHVGYWWVLDETDPYEKKKGWRLAEIRSVLSVSGDHYEFCELHGLGWNRVPENAKWIRINPPLEEKDDGAGGDDTAK